MDEILNRKLFRHKAQILKGEVIKRQVGGMSGPPQSPFTLTGIKQAFQTSPLLQTLYDPNRSGLYNALNVVNPFKKLQFVSRVPGAIASGYKAFSAAQKARGLSRAQQIARKYPRTTAGLEYGTAGLFGLEGAGDIIEGVREGDYGQIVQGVGEVGLGVSGIGPAGRLVGYGKQARGIGALRKGETAKGSELLAKGRQQSVAAKEFEKGKLYQPGKSLGLTLAGAYLADEDAGAEGLTDSGNVKLSDAADIEIKKWESANKTQLTPTQRAEAKKRLIQSQLPKEDFTDYLDGGVKSELSTKSAIGRNDPSNPSHDDDAITLATNKDNQAKQGKQLATKLASGKSKDAQEFAKFYSQIKELTGEQDNTGDLLMLKFASGLLSGKTGQSGVRGFMDVVGQATGPVIDTAIALNQKENENRKDLATAYLKAKKDTTNAFAVTNDRYHYLVKDPNALGGQRVVERARFKEGALAGYDAERVPTTDGKFMYQQVDYNPSDLQIDKNPKILDERRAQMEGLGTTYKMASLIYKMPSNLLGTPGKIKLLKEDVLGGMEALITSELGAGRYDNSTDAVKDRILKGDKDAIEKYEAEIKNKVKKAIPIFGRPTDAELEKLTRAARIETNLKYAYANALKDTDRLTEKNLEDAAKVTNIFGFITSPKKVKEQFFQLAKDADERFVTQVRRAQASGESNVYIIDTYSYMPYIQQYNQKHQDKLLREQVKQNLNPIIGSIKLQ